MQTNISLYFPIFYNFPIFKYYLKFSFYNFILKIEQKIRDIQLMKKNKNQNLSKHQLETPAR